MANCLINSGYALGCRDNIGGIQEAFIASFSGATTYTLDADNIITGITSTQTFYTYEQPKETGEFINGEGQISRENGTVFYVQTVNLTFHKNEADLRNSLILLAQAQLLVIVLDQNGRYWLVGKQNGADLITSSMTSGKAYGDMNGATVSIEGREPLPAFEVSATAFATLTVQ